MYRGFAQLAKILAQQGFKPLFFNCLGKMFSKFNPSTLDGFGRILKGVGAVEFMQNSKTYFFNFVSRVTNPCLLLFLSA